MALAQDVNSPTYKSALYRSQEHRWLMADDLMGGTEAMRARSQLYLPTAPAELPDSYTRRVAGSDFYNAYARTVRGLAGIVFRTPPTIADEVPGAIVSHVEDVDGSGSHLEVFARRVFEDALAIGHTHILVDFPTVNAPEALTSEEEQALGLRPYWIHVRADQIVSARMRSGPGKPIVEQVVIKETFTESDGPFGENVVVQYRVIRLEDDGPVWEVWTALQGKPGQKEWSITSSGRYANITAIPLITIHGGEYDGPFASRPPLEDLGYTNVAHYQVQSWHRHSLHVASVPILVFKGRDTRTEKEKISPEVAYDVPAEGSVEWVEHKGTALGQTRQELQDLEGRMAALGLAMMKRETRAAETAEAKRIDKEEQMSLLAVAARSLQDGLENALVFHANYLKVDAPEVDVPFDDEETSMTPEEINAWSNVVAKGQLSHPTFLQMLVDGGSLPDSFDVEEELRRLEEDEPMTITPAAPEGVPPQPPTPPNDSTGTPAPANPITVTSE